jgi:hypothetical protein
VSARPRVELNRTRDLGALFRDGAGHYLRELPVFLALSAAVVAPVELIVSGIGLEQLSSGYDPSPPAAEQGIQIAVSYLVIVPLVTAMVVHAMLAGDRGEGLAAGRAVAAGRSISAGLEAFAPVFAAMLIAGAGVALGLLLFIAPGIYLGVRWYFVPQAVVVDGTRNVGALRRSGELVQGSWWRVLAIGLLAGLAAIVPAALVELPFAAAAESADRDALALLGGIVAETITTPFVAIVATLLYFDLRERRREG